MFSRIQFWLRTVSGSTTPAEQLAQYLFDEMTFPAKDDVPLTLLYQHTGSNKKKLYWLGVIYRVACIYIVLGMKKNRAPIYQEIKDSYAQLIETHVKYPAVLHTAGDAFSSAYDRMLDLLELSLKGETIFYSWARQSLLEDAGLEVTDNEVLAAWAEACLARYTTTYKVLQEQLHTLAQEQWEM